MFFAGIDAHLNYVQIAVLDRFGKMTFESRISTTEPEGNIPKGANRWVRGALVSAIPSHTRFAPDSSLSATYQ